MENKELEITKTLMDEQLNIKDAVEKANQLIKNLKESDEDE